jgi:hypothetical protein
MDVLKRLVGVYLVGLALVVAVYFIINAFLVGSIDVLMVWQIVDIFMLVGLALGLAFNYVHKREAGARADGEAVTRGYMEANVAFYVTAGVGILFLHNWFSLLATGEVSQGDNHTAWVTWAVVDTLLPLVLGFTGCRLWREASAS